MAANPTGTEAMIGPAFPKKRRREEIYSNDIRQPSLKKRKIGNTKQKNDNHRMHPRNVYKNNKPNYYKLSQKYPFFAEVLQKNKKTGEYFVNFKDPHSNVMLTKVLLKNDFDLEFEHPLNRLCPPITQRLNYLLWIQDLLQCIRPKTDKYHGFDIGVGASCIFPLLGIKIGEQQNEKWSFMASDIDKESIEFAKNNVMINKFEQKIKIIHQTNPKHIFKGIIDEKSSKGKDILFDFTVCNPPFFEHLEECGHNRSRSNNATPSELVFSNGGEIGFIKLMIAEIEELKLQNRINWFSTMFGKKSSMKIIKTLLTERRAFVVSTEFFQGQQVRWGLAWTYMEKIKIEYNALHNPKETKTKIDDVFFKMKLPENVTDYNECLMRKMKKSLEKYGVKYDKQMFKNHENGCITIDDEKSNGFVFSFKWIITANRCKKGIEVSVCVTFKYLKGDKSLFDGFVKWFRCNVK